MSPVRNVQGKPSTAVTGKSTPQNPSITMVWITESISARHRFALQPCGTACLLAGSDLVDIVKFVCDLFPAVEFPVNFVLAAGIPYLEPEGIAGPQFRELLFVVRSGHVAVDFQDGVP